MRKRWLRRLIPIVLAVLMLCALIFPASGATVYFMSVNDMVLEMTAENMPLVVSSILYVPYTMFSSRITNVDLGVRAQYSASRGILTVTDGEKTVTFDTRRSTAYDENGTKVKAQAVVRNSMAFLPVHWLCNYFPTVRYTLNRTPHGILVRIVNNAVKLTDAQFVDAATDMLYENLLRYQSSIAEPEPSPSPTATATPEPTPTVSPSPPPTSSPTPPPTTTPAPAPKVWLAFRGGSNTAGAADALERAGLKGLFLFTSSELIVQDDLIRRLIARGHQVGLALTGSDPEFCLTQLAAGRQLIADIARTPVLIVSAPELDEEHHQALQDAGCAIWSTTLEAGVTTAAALLIRLNPEKENYLQFTCDENGVALLTRCLPSLTGDDYRLQKTLAPTL